jgi:hypothetical protein
MMEIEGMKDLINDAVNYMEKEITDYLSNFLRQQNLTDLHLMAVRDAFIRNLIKRLCGASHFLISSEWGREYADRDCSEFLKKVSEELKIIDFEEEDGE